LRISRFIWLFWTRLRFHFVTVVVH